MSNLHRTAVIESNISSAEDRRQLAVEMIEAAHQMAAGDADALVLYLIDEIAIGLATTERRCWSDCYDAINADPERVQ